MRPYSSHRHLQKLDPASGCGMTLCASRAGDTLVIPRHDAESRNTGKI